MGNKQLKACSTRNHKKERFQQQQQPSTSNDGGPQQRQRQSPKNVQENGDNETGCLSKVESLVKATATAAVPTARIRVHHTKSMDGEEYSNYGYHCIRIDGDKERLPFMARVMVLGLSGLAFNILCQGYHSLTINM
uniref:Uncharacterized protein n=1 Tax=Romanomermis culicivorax TaxID=13658 RepID=A0A915JGT7_ROMCU